MDFPEPGYRGSLKKFNRDPNGNGTFTDFGWLPRARKSRHPKSRARRTSNPSQPLALRPGCLNPQIISDDKGELTMLLKAVGAASVSVLLAGCMGGGVIPLSANIMGRTRWVIGLMPSVYRQHQPVTTLKM